MSWGYPERIKKMVLQMRAERVKGKRRKYQYALVSAPAIYYELCELHVSPLPSSRTIHRWLKQRGRLRSTSLENCPIPLTRFCPAEQEQ
jgi:hypothetical protein